MLTPATGVKYKCPKCEDRGYIITDRVTLTIETCECVRRRANQRRLERSGLRELVERCSFDSFQTAEDWQKEAKKNALAYLKSPQGAWFYLCGRSGSGKTHLCTAICKELIDSGKELYYFKWREDAPKLKAMIRDYSSYFDKLRQLSTVSVLYIDDFLKGTVTEADLNLAYQLLNERYNTQRRTIISSERSIQEIAKQDEAVAGRIFERSKGYCFMTANENYRFRKMQNENSQCTMYNAQCTMHNVQ